MYFKNLLILLALLPSLAHATGFTCREDFSGLVEKLRSRLRVLDHKLELRLNGKPFVADRMLGRKTSEVYLSEDGKEVAKIYSPGSVDANFEYWASQFLAEKGYRVTKVDGAPVTLPDGRIVLRKEYTAGLTWREVQGQGLPAATRDRIGDQLDALVANYTTLFTSGEFVTWLKAKGHTPDSAGIDAQRARTGDMDISNVLYTFDGWTIIDP